MFAKKQRRRKCRDTLDGSHMVPRPTSSEYRCSDTSVDERLWSYSVYVQDVSMPNFMSIEHRTNALRWLMIANKNHMQAYQTKNGSECTTREGMVFNSPPPLGLMA